MNNIALKKKRGKKTETEVIAKIKPQQLVIPLKLNTTHVSI